MPHASSHRVAFKRFGFAACCLQEIQQQQGTAHVYRCSRKRPCSQRHLQSDSYDTSEAARAACHTSFKILTELSVTMSNPLEEELVYRWHIDSCQHRSGRSLAPQRLPSGVSSVSCPMAQTTLPTVGPAFLRNLHTYHEIPSTLCLKRLNSLESEGNRCLQTHTHNFPRFSNKPSSRDPIAVIAQGYC